MTLQLPGYHDIRLIGEGGLGRVYLATRTSTGGTVAIKELRDIAAASPAWHRARRELDAMLRLKGHPYVVSVEEIVDGPTGPCLVMEYAPGGSLADRLGSGPLTTPEVILVGQQVSQALAAAHGAGLVHRDIKPHNLLIGQFGQVKVCDFGIAALIRDGGLHTQTQALTLGYASPEAMEGDQPVGPPADVYSFGATMVHLMTGRRPSMQECMSGVHPLLRADEPVLTAIVGVVLASLQHAPHLRPSMAQIVATFDRAATDLGPRRLASLAPRGAASAAPTAIRQAPAPAFDATVVRSAAAYQPTPPAPIHHAPVAPTVIAAVPVAAASQPHQPVQQYAAYDPLTARPARRRAGNALWAVATAVVVAVIIAGVVIAGRSADDARAATTASTTAAVDTAVSTAASVAVADTTAAPIVETAATAPPTVAVTAAPAPIATAAPATAPPAIPGAPIVSQVLASVVRAPSTDACGNPTDYQPTNVADRQLDTAWMAPGDGTGASLTFQLTAPSTVTRVGLVPGYDKFDPCTQTDRFFELRRITAVRWTFDDGSIIDQEVVPEPRMQYLDLPRPIVTSSVTMTVLRTLEPGLERLDHTPVSEVQVL